MLLDEFPQLRSWVERYPLKVVENASFWSDLLKVLRYFVANPCPRLYIRELPIEVHTKFIERNKGVLRELLDIVIVEHVCSDEKVFEKRFGLRYDESWVRIRVLEASIANEYFSGVDDLTMPQSQFCALSLPVQKVFVVENKINFLTFPKLAGSLLIGGMDSPLASSSLFRSCGTLHYIIGATLMHRASKFFRSSAVIFPRHKAF